MSGTASWPPAGCHRERWRHDPTLALIPLAVIASALAGIAAGLVTGWPGAGVGGFPRLPVAVRPGADRGEFAVIIRTLRWCLGTAGRIWYAVTGRDPDFPPDGRQLSPDEIGAWTDIAWSLRHEPAVYADDPHEGRRLS